MDDEHAEEAKSSLKKFHDLLMDIAESCEDTRELGLLTKAPNKKTPKPRENPKPRGGKPKERRNNPKAGEGKEEDERVIKKEYKPRNGGTCIFCGGDHFVKFCPKVPKSKKNWTFQQHLEAKRKTEENAGTENTRNRKTSDGNPGGRKTRKSGKDSGNPGGGKKRLEKRQENLLGEKEKTQQDTLCADGAAKVGPVSGFYTFDGGCDRATVGDAHAK